MKIGDVVIVSRGLPTSRTGKVVGITNSLESQGTCDTHDSDPHEFHSGNDTDFNLLKERLGISPEAQAIYWVDFGELVTRYPHGDDDVNEATVGEITQYMLER